MIKLLKLVLFFVLLIWGGVVSQGYAQKKISKASRVSKVYNPQYAAIVIEEKSGRVWHEENADTKVYPASLTKMITLYMLFEALEQKKLTLSTRMKVSALAVNQIPSKLGLRAGKTLRVQDAMFGLITKSANDAAVVIAEHMGGSVSQFAQEMTKKAHALGMNNTVFKNPNGVPDKEQYTTARDMAILSRALYQRFPSYCRYFNKRNFTYNGQVHKNHNHLLGKVPGVDGIKTGFIAASGFNLAASAKRNGMRIVVVVMGGKSSASRDAKVTELLDHGFYVASAGKQKHKGKEVYLASADEAKIHSPVKTDKSASKVTIIKRQPAVPETLRVSYKDKNSKKSVFSVAHAADLRAKEGTLRDWLVQVGAFKQAKIAHLKVKEIMKTAGLKGGKPSVAVTHGRKKLFQARVINLTQQQAQKMCQVLKKNGIACFAMKNGTRHLSLAGRP